MEHYGYHHRQERKRWRPAVDAGRVMCHAKRCLMPHRLIIPGTAWDLGHTEDGSRWTGPEHAKCNRSEGATRGNRARGRRKSWRLV